MREIKFRAWDKADERMIVHEQDFIPLKVTSIGVFRLSPTHEDYLYSLMSQKRFVLMQFTGLHDKNGKEVYEGDVVQWKRLDIKGVVYYNDEEVHYYVRELNRETESYLDSIEMEVIGNIYENPELL